MIPGRSARAASMLPDHRSARAAPKLPDHRPHRQIMGLIRASCSKSEGAKYQARPMAGVHYSAARAVTGAEVEHHRGAV